MGSVNHEWFQSVGEKRMLVYAPHADDEVLGAGGLLALAARLGWETHVHFATVSGYPSQNTGETSATSSRLAETVAALNVLKCSGHEILFAGEQYHLRLDTVPQTELVSFAERGLQRIRPSIVVGPCWGHYHQDHRALADAITAALRPSPRGTRPMPHMALAYGHAHAGWGGERYAFRCSVFVDITEVIDAKLEALACYGSQLCEEPHARNLAMVREQAGACGAYAGVRYAEAFECLRLLLA